MAEFKLNHVVDEQWIKEQIFLYNIKPHNEQTKANLNDIYKNIEQYMLRTQSALLRSIRGEKFRNQYGDKTDHNLYYGSDEYKKDCEIWHTPRSWFELSAVMIKFINGEIPSIGYTSHIGKYRYENTKYQNILREINRAGIITTNGQSAGKSITANKLESGRHDLHIIRREYISIIIPKIHSEEFISQLLKHNVFISVLNKYKHHNEYIRFKYQDNFLILYRDNIDGLDDFWKQHIDKKHQSDIIPLTLYTGYNGDYKKMDTWIPCFSLSAAHASGINYWNINAATKAMSICIFDPTWSTEPYHVFNIVKEISQNITIADIKLEPIEPKVTEPSIAEIMHNKYLSKTSI